MKETKPHITLPNSTPSEELYRFGADGNLRLYSYDRLFYSLYGYDGGTTRTYKYSMDLSPNWVNGRLESVNFNLHTAMFYPNSYLNFNNDGYYTKHYYNGMERIASRLGDQNLPISTHAPELQDRKDWQDSLIRKSVVEITGYEFLPAGEEQDPDDPKPEFELPQVGMTGLQPIGSGDVYYYHPNHLGSTCYVTDGNASVQQGFLYAPFGEITNEHNLNFGYSVIPKYSFNAKEMDEETGMYYYEARYMAPPVFISRDPLFEKYPTFSPYAYCANNPVKYVDPDGREGITVSGSPGDHKNKRHFLENGLDRSKQATAHFQRKGEKSTWIIYNDKKKGYTADLLKEYTKKAEKAGINVKVVSDVKEIIDYVNNKNGNDTRARDKITSFYYVGHAKPGDLKVGYNGTGQDFDPSNFKAEAFSSGTYVDVVGGCRTAVDWGLGFIDPSIIKQFSKILDSKSEIHGSSVRVQYNGGIMTNKQLLKENNGEEVIIKGRLK